MIEGDWDDAIESREEAAETEESSAYFVDLWRDGGSDVLARFSRADGPEWNVLEEHTVDEVMNRRIIDIAPDAVVADAARIMLHSGVHRLLVRERDRLLGVVTTSDLLRVLAGQTERSFTPAAR
jgi:CBS-domain-containing membrane protein